MSATIASGASKPNGAGLPMFSLRILCPSASSRWASTRIGPRTSYRTCWSLRLWTIGRMGHSLAEQRGPLAINRPRMGARDTVRRGMARSGGLPCRTRHIVRTSRCATSATRPSSRPPRCFPRAGPAVPDERHRARAHLGRRAAGVQPRVLHRLHPRRAGCPALQAAGAVHGQAGGLRPPDRRPGDALDAPHLGRPRRRRGVPGGGAALPQGRRGGRDLPRGARSRAPSRSRS